MKRRELTKLNLVELSLLIKNLERTFSSKEQWIETEGRKLLSTVQLQCCGSGSDPDSSGTDLDSTGSVDPDPRGKEK